MVDFKWIGGLMAGLSMIHSQMNWEQWGSVGWLGPVGMAAGLVCYVAGIFKGDK